MIWGNALCGFEFLGYQKKTLIFFFITHGWNKSGHEEYSQGFLEGLWKIKILWFCTESDAGCILTGSDQKLRK